MTTLAKRIAAWRARRRKDAFVPLAADGLALLREADARGSALEGPLDRWYRYSFNPTLRANEVVAFESAHGARLPEDYRDFLLFIGNGGAGPDYGVNALGRVDTHLGPPGTPPREEDLRRDAESWSSMVGELARPFPLRKPGRRRAIGQVDGAVPIANVGCGTWSWLVLTGESRGVVWCCREADGLGWTTARDTFRDWYLDWLEWAIARAAAP